MFDELPLDSKYIGDEFDVKKVLILICIWISILTLSY